MCGVYGFIARGDRGPDLERLRVLAVETEKRGPHAFGFAWVDGAGRLRSYKAPGKVSEHLDLLDRMADARVLVGHCRWATHGAPSENVNNHPHPCDGGWLVHNGIIHNADALRAENDLRPVGECDSEILALLVEASAEDDLLGRCMDAARAAEGALVVMALWKPSDLVLVRRGNPLWAGQASRGLYFASRQHGLPADRWEVRDDCAYRYSRDAKGGIQYERRPLLEDGPDDAPETSAPPPAKAAKPKAAAPVLPPRQHPAARPVDVGAWDRIRYGAFNPGKTCPRFGPPRRMS